LSYLAVIPESINSPAVTGTAIYLIIIKIMNEKKPLHILHSPDLTKMQEVVIDHRTKIYIPKGADPEAARSRYLSRPGGKKY